MDKQGYVIIALTLCLVGSIFFGYTRAMSKIEEEINNGKTLLKNERDSIYNEGFLKGVATIFAIAYRDGFVRYAINETHALTLYRYENESVVE